MLGREVLTCRRFVEEQILSLRWRLVGLFILPHLSKHPRQMNPLPLSSREVCIPTGRKGRQPNSRASVVSAGLMARTCSAHLNLMTSPRWPMAPSST